MQNKPPIQHVTVTGKASDPQDAIATRNLLEACNDGEKYQCPRCPYSTLNPEEMIHHLADEINKSILFLQQLPTTRRPPKPGAR